MSKQADYVAGWIDTTVHDFLRDIAEPPSNMAYALVTCLDSEFDVASLADRSPHLRSLTGKGERVGSGILVTTRQLLAADRQERIFFGFDEVWFFPKRDVTPKPEGLVMTGPEHVTPDDLRQHGDWMKANSCSLGLGDGTGLNYCLRVKGVAQYVVAALNGAGMQSLDETQ